RRGAAGSVRAGRVAPVTSGQHARRGSDPGAAEELSTIHIALALYYLQRGMTLRLRGVSLAIVLAALTAAPFAQSGAREQLARGRALWDQRLAQSAIAALEI